MADKVDVAAIATRAQAILSETHSDGSKIDRENLAIRIAKLEAALKEIQFVTAQHGRIEAVRTEWIHRKATEALTATARRASALAALEQQP